MPSTRALLTRYFVRTLLKPYLMSGSLAQQRRRFASLAFPRWLIGAAVEPTTVEHMAAEWITPRNADPERVIYYLHGGGFVACSPATHRGIAARLAREGGARALLIDYRLAPEHTFPAQVEDAVLGYRWLLAKGARPGQIAIAGDSAGGALTLSTLLSLRDAGEPLPAAAVCLSPVVDATQSGESYRTRARDEAMLTMDFCRQAVRAYVGDGDPRAPLVSPLYADLYGLPPLLVHVGTHELLLDDAVRLADRAQRAGVDVTLRVFDGMWHVFHGFECAESRAAAREIGAFVRERIGRAPERAARAAG